MKLNLHNILLSLGLSITASAAFSAASAQDIQYPALNELSDTTLIDRDRALIALGEPEPRTKVSKDSLSNSSKSQANRNAKVTESNKAVLPKTETEAAAKQDEDDDSILSFNFLYYIFQKYKLQDIVD
jgi:hypothetical protein